MVSSARYGSKVQLNHLKCGDISYFIVYKSGKKTQQYLTEFKVTAVRLSLREGATVKSVALSLDIHPYMLSKWRKA